MHLMIQDNTVDFTTRFPPLQWNVKSCVVQSLCPCIGLGGFESSNRTEGKTLRIGHDQGKWFNSNQE